MRSLVREQGCFPTRRYPAAASNHAAAFSTNEVAAETGMKRVEESLLYTFIDTAYLRGRDPAEVARELCAGGSDLIQLRAKELALDEVRRMAERVAPIIRSAELLFVINDHVRVAMEVGAQFCHLGQEDFFDGGYVDVNQLTGTGSGLKIGLSSHAPDQATRAVSAGAAYVAVGPVFATPTKPGARAVTVDYVRWA